MSKYLDLTGLASYDGKIKDFIEDKVQGRFIIDAANMALADINGSLSAAGTWGENNGGRAQVVFASAPSQINLSSVVFASNCDYYMDYSATSGSLNLSGLSNFSFRCSSLSSATSVFLTVNNCENAEFYNVSILNIMGANLISNSSQVYFENCIIQGGTYADPDTCCCRISDTQTSFDFITFENCVFKYNLQASTPLDSVIDGSGITNANCSVTFINCLSPSNMLLNSSDYDSGSGNFYLLNPTKTAYAETNGIYSNMTVGLAQNASNATNLNNLPASNYAQINGTYSNMTVGKAVSSNPIPGTYLVDSATMTATQINQIISQASSWGGSNGGKAKVIFQNQFNSSMTLYDVEFLSDCDYYLDYSMSGGDINLTNVENIGFYSSSISSVVSVLLNMSGCNNIEFNNVSILNGMGASLISNCNQIYFENCIIKGSTYPNPNTCSCKISDTTTANNYIIFENCIFQYGSTSSPATVIDGSGITNANCRVTFINCLNPSNASISASDIMKGSGKWYALSPASL